MSYSTAAASMAGGVLFGYGLYTVATAKGSAAEVASQRKTALLAMAVGIGLFGVGFADNLFPLLPTRPLTLKNMTHCDTIALNHILKNGGENTLSQKVFKAFEETQGITCDNFLPWQDHFHLGGTGYIDGVHINDLAKPAMWGVDFVGRPFMSLKYRCVHEAGRLAEGAMTLFQRYTDTANITSTGGHFEAANCYPNLGAELLRHPNHTAFAQKVRDFLAGNFLITDSSVLSLAK